MTQVARYQPNSAPAAQLATPAFATSPAQSILRRFFSVDDTHVCRVAFSLWNSQKLLGAFRLQDVVTFGSCKGVLVHIKHASICCGDGTNVEDGKYEAYKAEKH